MTKVIGTFESGQITVDAGEHGLGLALHWPFDRSSDEWIDLSADFAGSDFQFSEKSGVWTARSASGAEFSLRETSSGSYRLYIKGSNAVRSGDADLVIPNGIGRELQDEIALRATEV